MVSISIGSDDITTSGSGTVCDGGFIAFRESETTSSFYTQFRVVGVSSIIDNYVD